MKNGIIIIKVESENYNLNEQKRNWKVLIVMAKHIDNQTTTIKYIFIK